MDDGLIELPIDDALLTIFAPDGPFDTDVGNLDVEVSLGSGERWAATFFTLRGVAACLEDDRQSFPPPAHCFWWDRLVVVDDLSPVTIAAVVRRLLKNGELTQAFERLQ